MTRTRLISLMQERAEALGVVLHHATDAPDPKSLDVDLVVASDGADSTARRALASDVGPHVEMGDCRCTGLAPDRVFEAFTFIFVETPAGVLQIHAYPYDADGSKFIVEMREEVWRALGCADLAPASPAPGESDTALVARPEEFLGDVLGGHRLLEDNSQLISFPTLTVDRCSSGNVVLLGDAAHTAHFSIASAPRSRSRTRSRSRVRWTSARRCRRR